MRIDWLIIDQNDRIVRFFNGKLGPLDVELAFEIKSKLQLPCGGPLRFRDRPRLSELGAFDKKAETCTQSLIDAQDLFRLCPRFVLPLRGTVVEEKYIRFMKLE